MCRSMLVLIISTLKSQLNRICPLNNTPHNFNFITFHWPQPPASPCGPSTLPFSSSAAPCSPTHSRAPANQATGFPPRTRNSSRTSRNALTARYPTRHLLPSWARAARLPSRRWPLGKNSKRPTFKACSTMSLIVCLVTSTTTASRRASWLKCWRLSSLYVPLRINL